MLLFIAGCILFGCLSSSIASKKGRDPYAWFAIGFGFGIFGLIAAWLFPPLSQEDKKNPYSSESTLPAPQQLPETLWYYLDGTHQQIGPLPVEKMRKLIDKGEINPTTLVWSAGMQDWTPLKNVSL